MTTKQPDAMSVLAILARMHGTTLAEEVDKHNADIEWRIAHGDIHPPVTAEERVAREKASRRRYLDKEKAKRAAARALKPKPSAEEIAAKAAAKAEREKASRRRHHVKARDALRALRKETGSVRGGGPQKGVWVPERPVRTATEKRSRKVESDKRYRVATRNALRSLKAGGQADAMRECRRERRCGRLLTATPK